MINYPVHTCNLCKGLQYVPEGICIQPRYPSFHKWRYLHRVRQSTDPNDNQYMDLLNILLDTYKQKPYEFTKCPVSDCCITILSLIRLQLKKNTLQIAVLPLDSHSALVPQGPVEHGSISQPRRWSNGSPAQPMGLLNFVRNENRLTKAIFHQELFFRFILPGEMYGQKNKIPCLNIY